MKFSEGYKYQLEEDFIIKTSIFHPSKDNIVTPWIILFRSGKLFIRKGYAWDGPSGPTWDWLDNKSVMTPSLVHDALYQLIRMERLDPGYRDYADEVLGILMRKRTSKWRAIRWLQVLRSRIWTRETKKFGGSSADPKNRRKIYEVL
jgi:hypothetical protein